MASACFSFGRRFPGLAGAECLSEGDFTDLDGERITVEGRVEKIVPKEEWLVLELGEAAVKKGRKGRRERF